MTDPTQPPYQPPPAFPPPGPPTAPPPPPPWPGDPGPGGAGPANQPAAQPGGSATPSRAAGMMSDPSTLAATGLLAAVLFATGAGLIGFLANPRVGGFRARLLALTDTVDVGDVALLGLAVALLLLTPDPPGGFGRPVLLQVTAALAAIITVYAVIRSLVLISSEGSAPLLLSGFVATVGVGIAAATIAFYAAKESFLKKEGRI